MKFNYRFDFTQNPFFDKQIEAKTFHKSQALLNDGYRFLASPCSPRWRSS